MSSSYGTEVARHLREERIQQLEAENRELAERVKKLEAALGRIQKLQPDALEVIRKHNFVFTKLASDLTEDSNAADRWEVLAFSLYTRLCEAESVARAALEEAREALKWTTS